VRNNEPQAADHQLSAKDLMLRAVTAIMLVSIAFWALVLF
jgi:hypothetical protein